MAIIDGGGDSPIALAFFIPLVFVGLSYPVRSVIWVGILGIVGYLAVAAACDDPPGHTLMFASTLLGVALMSGWQARNHDRRREQIAQMSRTDPLTGALNRRGFEDAASGVLAGAERFTWPVCLLLFDLNDFKGYNDRQRIAAWSALGFDESAEAIDAVSGLAICGPCDGAPLDGRGVGALEHMVGERHDDLVPALKLGLVEIGRRRRKLAVHLQRRGDSDACPDCPRGL